MGSFVVHSFPLLTVSTCDFKLVALKYSGLMRQTFDLVICLSKTLVSSGLNKIFRAPK